MTSALEQLQAVAVQQIVTDAMFDGSQSVNGDPVPIITEKRGDILTEINTQLGKIGLCVVVLTPVFDLHDVMIQSLNATPGWQSRCLKTSFLTEPGSDLF